MQKFINRMCMRFTDAKRNPKGPKSSEWTVMARSYHSAWQKPRQWYTSKSLLACEGEIL